MSFQVDPTMCEGCWHYRSMAADGTLACHCLLDTGKRRKMDGDKCLSKAKEPEVENDPFEVPVPQR